MLMSKAVVICLLLCQRAFRWIRPNSSSQPEPFVGVSRRGGWPTTAPRAEYEAPPACSPVGCRVTPFVGIGCAQAAARYYRHAAADSSVARNGGPTGMARSAGTGSMIRSPAVPPGIRAPVNSTSLLRYRSNGRATSSAASSRSRHQRQKATLAAAAVARPRPGIPARAMSSCALAGINSEADGGP
jgi:hypothetical protein